MVAREGCGVMPCCMGGGGGNVFVGRGTTAFPVVYTWNTVVICKCLLTKASLMG